jgi:hypothetical protein
MPDLVDFASAFPNNTANEVVRDKDLLRLKLVLLRGVVVVEEVVGCSCRDWNTQERRRKASTRVDVYS